MSGSVIFSFFGTDWHVVWGQISRSLLPAPEKGYRAEGFLLAHLRGRKLFIYLFILCMPDTMYFLFKPKVETMIDFWHVVLKSFLFLSNIYQQI
jgi:hypothetical protein